MELITSPTTLTLRRPPFNLTSRHMMAGLLQARENPGRATAVVARVLTGAVPARLE